MTDTIQPNRRRGAAPTEPAPAAASPPAAAEPVEVAAPAPSKTAALRKLMERTRGASLAELVAASGWQPHSARAWLTGMRKRHPGAVVRDSRKNGESCYRFVEAA